MALILAGELALGNDSSLAGAICDYNTTETLRPTGNDDDETPPATDGSALTTGYTILAIGGCIAAVVCLLVALAKSRLAFSSPLRAGQPKGT